MDQKLEEPTGFLPDVVGGATCRCMTKTHSTGRMVEEDGWVVKKRNESDRLIGLASDVAHRAAESDAL